MERVISHTWHLQPEPPDVVCEIFRPRRKLILWDWPYRWQLLPITRREQQIIKLLTLGYSSKEIAQRIKITPRTVEFHQQRAMVKCGIRNRAGLVLYAVIEGLISPEELAQFTRDRIAWIEQRARLASEEGLHREFLTPAEVVEHARSSRKLYNASRRECRERPAAEKETERTNELRLPGTQWRLIGEA